MANLFFLVICLVFVQCQSSQPESLFILAGQSNMGGRGGVPCNTNDKEHCHWDGYIPPECQPRSTILRFTNQSNWELARDPLHWDIDPKKVTGVGPGMAFANSILAKANKTLGVVGLVPCAIGGTHIREWVKGTAKYTFLVDRIRGSQMTGGKVKAFMWFQGESDASFIEDSEYYERNLTKLLTDIRIDLQLPNLPVILVKISNNDPFVFPRVDLTDVVRNAQEAVKRKLPNVGIIDAKKAISRVNQRLKPSFNKDGHLSVYTEVDIGKMLAVAYLHQFG